MAGLRYELSSGSTAEPGFSRNHTTGQRGSFAGAKLDRPGSFRNTTLMCDLPSVTQCLSLEPIPMGDQKYNRAGELRRILGVSFGSAEDSSCGAAHSKLPPAVATEELKRFKASVVDGCYKARGRVKRLEESLNKLNKYCDVSINSKKQQRTELLSTERSNLLKIGTQVHRQSHDLATQRLEDRTKNVVLNKRVRTSVAETRAESRSNVILRQPVAVGKDKDMLKDGGAVVEEKIRRLPAGEGWDKKMKRKRSVAAAFSRSMDNEGEVKRPMHNKLSNDPALQSGDATHNFRSGPSNGISRSDGVSLLAGSSTRITLKNDVDKGSLSKDLSPALNKERLISKGNNKLNIREDNHVLSPTSTLPKVKASRVLRPGSVSMSNSLSNYPCPDGANEVPSAGGFNNRKRQVPTGSSSPPMAKWVGQRPHKNSRMRRSNLVSPVSNQGNDGPSITCPPADFAPKIISSGTQQIRMKLDNISSPTRASESEESENKSKEKEINSGCEAEDRATNAGLKSGLPAVPIKKSKVLLKEEIGDAVRKQGRSGRGSLFSGVNVSSMREKLDSITSAKPLRSTSRSARPPVKKISDRKNFGRLVQSNSASPDLTGESDDDREELLASASFACDASYLACTTSTFWKKMEPIFALSGSDDTSYLNQQLGLSEEHLLNSSPMSVHGNNLAGNFLYQDVSHSQTEAPSGQRQKCMTNQIGQQEPSKVADFNNLGGQFDSGTTFCKVNPLFQRVFSALIAEEEIEEYEENLGGKNSSIPYDTDELMESDEEGAADRYYCNWSSTINKVPSSGDLSCNGNQNSSGISTFNCQYEQMSIDDRLLLELQSIGLHPETVPEPVEGGDEAIDQDILEIKKGLHQQVGKKTAHLSKLKKAIQDGKEVEGRALEQVAMDRLVEISYKKQLATRGSSSSKTGVVKVSKQVARAFMKRTLARSRKFEESGDSCFSEPSLRDVLFASPPRLDAEEHTVHHEAGKGHTQPSLSGSLPYNTEQHNHYKKHKIESSLDTCEPLTPPSDNAFVKNGPISNRGKKKEVSLDDFSLRTASPFSNTHSGGGAKGKRSERDRDKDVSSRNSNRLGRPPLNAKSKPKTKAKPKQKSGPSNCTHNTVNRKEVGVNSSSEIKDQMDITSLQLHELDPIEELGGNGQQDLSSWLDVDGLQDHYTIGLDIPMDDLSELNMLM